MGVPFSKQFIVAGVCAALLAPAVAAPVEAQWRRYPGWGDRDRRVERYRQPGLWRRGPFAEPAAARGFSDGYEEGLNDGRRRSRYDPVRSRDYRKADAGYFRAYGSRDAYKNNYRAGFRQGYEEGYRDGTRYRR